MIEPITLTEASAALNARPTGTPGRYVAVCPVCKEPDALALSSAVRHGREMLCLACIACRAEFRDLIRPIVSLVLGVRS